MIMVQFILIILNKQSIDSKTYIFTEVIFKVTLSFFIEYFLYTRVIQGLDFEDKLLFSFAGALLLFDALAHDLPQLLKKYDIVIPIQGIKSDR
jgi:hypothetical protein